jgi:D-alanyl-D-alanine carboxypeptidase/D-alanyl-D-alanine-endopeptidase (penicillin-binding protein 4)
VDSEPFGRTITHRGTVPAGEKIFTVAGAIPDPPALALEMLDAHLKGAGVIFSAAKQSADSPPAASDATPEITLASHRSATLPEIIDHLHRFSDNLEAQCLFLTLGIHAKRDPSAALRAYWESRGIVFTGLRLIDGSGLARANMIRTVE